MFINIIIGKEGKVEDVIGIILDDPLIQLIQ